MASVIIDRVSGVVPSAPVNPNSIIQANSVTGTNSIVAETFPGISAYFPNMLFLIRPASANTGPVTIDFGPGALPWNKPSGAAHGNGDISPDLEYLIKLDEDMSEFRTISPSF